MNCTFAFSSFSPINYVALKIFYPHHETPALLRVAGLEAWVFVCQILDIVRSLLGTDLKPLKPSPTKSSTIVVQSSQLSPPSLEQKILVCG